MTDRNPAVLGGSPAFPDGLRLLRPSLPSPGKVLPGVEAAIAGGMLTKGATAREYERRPPQALRVAPPTAAWPRVRTSASKPATTPAIPRLESSVGRTAANSAATDSRVNGLILMGCLRAKAELGTRQG